MIRKLYRGVWADRLDDGDVLPIGGSIFGEELTVNLFLDFNSLNPLFKSQDPKGAVNSLYDIAKPKIASWLNQLNAAIDPYLFFVSNLVNSRVRDILEVNNSSRVSHLERMDILDRPGAKLSSLKGKTMCAEQAALGQHLLQNVLDGGYLSSYMSGVTCENQNGEDMENHAVILLQNKVENTYVFDIARQKSQHNLPRLLKTDLPFSYALFKGENNLLIGSTEVLQKGRIYFGVGHPNLAQEPIILDRDNRFNETRINEQQECMS